nr:LuxR C-terminal-related transcriptional regulator [Sphingomonas yunnanensis]
MGRLTPREREVLGCLVDGNTNEMIGQRLGISPRTVELHRAQVMSRLNAGTLAELVQIAMGAGMTSSTSCAETRRISTQGSSGLRLRPRSAQIGAVVIRERGLT